MRMMAFLGDFAMGYTAFYYLYSFDYFSKLYLQLSSYLAREGLVEELAWINSHYLATAVLVFLLTLVLRFYATLFLGVSFGQGVLGIRGTGGFLWKRIGGGARVVLEVLLGPALIFNLPVFFGKRSLKELLTSTVLVEKPTLISASLPFILIPLCVLGAFFAPLLQNLTLIDGISVSFSQKIQERLDNRSDFKSFETYSSNRFKMSSLSSLNKGRFILLPSFEVTKVGNKRKITPYIQIYDKKNQTDGILKITKKFNLLRLLEIGRVGNPLFVKRYPELDLILAQDRKKFGRKKYHQDLKRTPLINPLGQEEIESFIQSSFELSLSHLFGHILNNGPFLRGYVQVRNKMMELIDLGSTPEVDMVNLGSHRFLRLKQSFEDPLPDTKGQVESLIPLGTNNSMVFQFSWKKNIQAALARKAFRSTFLGNSHWFFDYYGIFEFPKSELEMNPLHILDYFTKQDLNPQQRELLEEYIYRYYYNICRYGLISKDLGLQELLLANLNRYLLVARVNNSLKRNYYSDKFLSLIKELKKNMLRNNKDYYNY
ncbi:MAG: hypothetical protein HN509_15160 [Halobacteriovoraceae bacterium]|nr:hypothetical protein [Halobacteriovoraceae bacterium]MBT5094031.1 hypothetical protein [Halobacteriovoraceae bacterium]